MLCDYAACDWDRNLQTQSRVPNKQRDIINTAVTLIRHWLSERVKSGQESEPGSQRERSEHGRLCACLCVSERVRQYNNEKENNNCGVIKFLSRRAAARNSRERKWEQSKRGNIWAIETTQREGKVWTITVEWWMWQCKRLRSCLSLKNVFLSRTWIIRTAGRGTGHHNATLHCVCLCWGNQGFTACTVSR